MLIFGSLFLDLIAIVADDPAIPIVADPVAFLVVENTRVLIAVIFLMVTFLVLVTILFVLGFEGDKILLRVLGASYAGLSVRLRLVKWRSILILKHFLVFGGSLLQ